MKCLPQYLTQKKKKQKIQRRSRYYLLPAKTLQMWRFSTLVGENVIPYEISILRKPRTNGAIIGPTRLSGRWSQIVCTWNDMERQSFVKVIGFFTPSTRIPYIQYSSINTILLVVSATNYQHNRFISLGYRALTSKKLSDIGIAVTKVTSLFVHSYSRLIFVKCMTGNVLTNHVTFNLGFACQSIHKRLPHPSKRLQLWIQEFWCSYPEWRRHQEPHFIWSKTKHQIWLLHCSLCWQNQGHTLKHDVCYYKRRW